LIDEVEFLMSHFQDGCHNVIHMKGAATVRNACAAVSASSYL